MSHLILSQSSLVAVTGWPSVLVNNGTEVLLVSRNSGVTWSNVMGNLRSVTGTVAQVRPAGLTFLPGNVLVVGTTRGVFYSSQLDGRWTRLGDLSQFPQVLVVSTRYDPVSDTLVAASFGRGVYIVEQISKHLKTTNY